MHNCKVELKRKLINHCVLSTAGADNADADSNNIIFTMKVTKFYVPVVTFPAKENQKLSKLFSKESERSVYWNEYKTKSENKITRDKYRYFLQSSFVRVKRLFVLTYSYQETMLKVLKVDDIIYQRYY